MNDHDLVLLAEVGDPMEVASIRSLLDAHSIEYVVQGEHHAAMVAGLFGNPALAARVLVARRDVERAAAMLQATPLAETQASQTLDGAVCAVHEEAALATCGRCGSFLCAKCNALGNPPTCEACLASESSGRARRNANVHLVRKGLAGALLLPYVLGALLLVALLLAKLFG